MIQYFQKQSHARIAVEFTLCCKLSISWILAKGRAIRIENYVWQHFPLHLFQFRLETLL